MTLSNLFVRILAGLAAVMIIHGVVWGYKPGDAVPPDFEMPTPLGLEESVARLRTVAGLKVELMVAEPMVMDAINIDWGPDGRLWVVEMADYPLGMDGAGEAGGRVRVLTDRDGDGAYDESVLFLGGLSYPTDVKVWRDGVLITLSGKIIYARDRDGDGRADAVDTLYAGFDEGNPQHLINGMEWGLDNWLHLASGSSKGSAPHSIKTGKSLGLISTDVRIDPMSGDIESLGGRSQYGRVRDAWGNWFGCQNSNPIFQHLLGERYTRRNPEFPAPAAKVQVSDEPLAPRVYPTSEVTARFNNAASANFMTSACSLLIYEDDLLKDHIDREWFICEPVHNLVHREPLSGEGIYFRSSRDPDEASSEFLTSSDAWFRPTTVKAGPNGALWVVDMHRFVIEHPEWIPEEWMEVIDVRAGHDKGRIYRLTPADGLSFAVPDLEGRSTMELVETLASPVRWQRDMAQKLLVWRRDEAAVPALREMVETHSEALARLHALGTLDGLGATGAALLLGVFEDAHPAVRRHAVRLSEPFFDSSEKLLSRVAELAGDPDEQVRLQVALSLGESLDPVAGEALAGLVLRHFDDEIMRAALMSSALPHQGLVVDRLLNDGGGDAGGDAGAEKSFVRLAVVSDEGAVLRRLIRWIADVKPDQGGSMRQAKVLGFLLEALHEKRRLLGDLNPNDDPEVEKSLTGIAMVMKETTARARGSDASENDKRLALPMLGVGGDPGEESDLMGEWLRDQSSPALQIASARRLAALGTAEAFSHLTAGWSSYTPMTKERILGLLMATRAGRVELLGVVERGGIAASSIGVAQRQALTGHPDAKTRERAQAVFGGVAERDRQAVIDRYAAVKDLKGDVERGRKFFAASCSVCHRLNGIGFDIGANLAALTDKSTGSLLVGILDPNRAIEDKYMLYVISTEDGQTLSGMLTDESAASVTVAGLDGQRQTLMRANIRSMITAGRSMMPEGLEAVLDEQALADIIAFIQQAPGAGP